MNCNMNVDLDELKNCGLFPEEFLLLCIINEGVDPCLFSWRNGLINIMMENVWITKNSDGEYLLRGKAEVLFEKKKSLVNFDEFWDVFPSVTPGGRPLRATSKEWGNKPTRDYSTCKKKYLNKVKTIDYHNKIVSILKARVSINDYEFINNIETYINQEKWQQDVTYLTARQKGSINDIV